MSGLQWFRFHHEALDDPKVQKLEPALFKHWVNLLCLACRNEGKLPSHNDMAFALRIDEIGLESVLDRLLIAGLIGVHKGGPNGSHIAPNGWDKRQYKSDASTDRVKRYRERSRNDTVTPPETETDTETDSSANALLARGLSPDLAAVKDAWNAVCDRTPLTTVVVMNDRRKKGVRTAIADHGLDTVCKAIAEIENAPFLLGQGDRGWRLDFDTLIKPKTMLKLIEGGYHGNTGKKSGWLEA